MAYNSKMHGRKSFNAARYAAQRPRVIREIRRLFPQRGSSMQGWSQLESDPSTYLRPRSHKRMVEHYLFGCTGEPIVESTDKNGNVTHKKNEDGSIARVCTNTACGGRWQGVKDLSQIPPRISELMGIASDSKGQLHYKHDDCRKTAGHRDKEGFGLAASPPTLADLACMVVKVPVGRHRPGEFEHRTIQELLHNHDNMWLGDDEHGQPIYPGRYRVDTSNDGWKPKVASAALRVSNSVSSACTSMRRLVEAGETNPRKYFEVGQDHAWEAFRTKRGEIKPDDEHPDEYVGIMPGSGIDQDGDHTVINGSLRTIRETLGKAAIVPTGPRAEHHTRWWDMMLTPNVTQTFNPHHIFDEQLNPMNTVIDVQHHDELAKSDVPGVKESFFAGYPMDIPGIGNMQDLGNVGKRDPFSSFYRSRAIGDFIHRLVRGHKERDTPMRYERTPKFQGYDAQVDPRLLEAMSADPERFKRVDD